ncbi:acetyltransferase-like isoleucine patch superfamily enzyme [Hydrogenispora ethanolica]|uniref:Acetyltransferase-like isoleucine patch superfamily enzyme n=1 Tax=Hydrogenispora ethanolica TaxID=1082276 RepID=A0A4R1RWD3_HYDET|nr:acyltransferase [Hydrogenispora ethanolica]TCL70754.1 acetyltransferase-like isoleucine patch superfamily enzyme [Hydrogenispora ethanolica]
MEILVRLFGLIKLVIYKFIYRYRIVFHLTTYFHPFATITMNKKARLYLGEKVKIEKGVTLSVNVNGVFNIKKAVYLRKYSYFEVGTGAKLTIGEGTFLNRNAQIVCMNEIYLDKHIAIGTGVSMFDHDHYYFADCVQNWELSKKGNIYVERDVWIGANAILLRNCKIGHNTVIAAGVVVREEIPANTLMYLDKKSYAFKDIPPQSGIQ